MNFSLFMFDTVVTPFLADAMSSPSGGASTDALTAIFSGVAAIIGALGTKMWCSRGAKEREDAIRRETELKVRAEIPQPVITEQSAYQALMKANASVIAEIKDSNERDHENIFNRIRKIESDHAALAARFDTSFQFIQKQLDSLTSMTSQLFDRIMGGAKKK